MSLSAHSFEVVTRYFQGQSGIRLGPDKHALVQGRLQRLAAEAGQPDLDAYVRWALSGDSQSELTKLVDRLTTNETFFFREPQHFSFLSDLVRKPGVRSQGFRVWSAASSSGEEAYSVAMVLHDRLGGNADWSIVGTDLSTAMVDSAQRGLYSLDRASGIPDYYLRQFCLKGSGEYQGKMLMSKALRAKTRFTHANLLEPLPRIGSFDVIFLRNVLIYFDPASKTQIVRRVLELLKPGGYLLSGHSESLSTLDLPLRQVKTAVYCHA